eukprot:COSAG01_NODE_2379_length_7794_cov_7.414295_8_plen_111_part_00
MAFHLCDRAYFPDGTSCICAAACHVVAESPHVTGASGDHGIANMWNGREISVSSDFDRFHYLRPHPYAMPAHTMAGFWRGKRCLEIGAGTGILGLAAARLVRPWCSRRMV